MLLVPLEYCLDNRLENIIPINIKSEAQKKQIDYLENLKDTIKLNKFRIDFDNNNFRKFIESHPENFASRKNLDHFFKVWTVYISDIYESYDVITPAIQPFTLPTIISTEGYLASIYDDYDYAYDEVSAKTLWLVGGCFVVFIASLLMGWIGIGAYALLFGSAIGSALNYTELFSSGFKILLALCMMMMCPSVTNEIDTQHENAILELEQQLGADAINGALYVSATDTIIGVPNIINSNGLSFLITPDGRISKYLKYGGNYVGFKGGNYSVIAYRHGDELFSDIRSTSFQVSKPNITLNLLSTLQGNVATIYLSIENHESTKIENLTSLFDIKNTSNVLSFAKIEALYLNPMEVKNLSYIVDLANLDIYTASASLLIGSLNELEEKKIAIPVGVTTAEDVAILKVGCNSQYSSHNSINMNMTIQSYAPDLAVNISIPRFNYMKPVIVTDTNVIDISLPKLSPDYYITLIRIEKDGKVLDSKIISFYVQADGVGLLTFNASQLVYSTGKSSAINLSLKDLNMTDVDANVGVTVFDPSGSKRDCPANKTSDGYRFDFLPTTNGTYMLEAHAFKEGWRIDNNTFTVIASQMSPIKMNVTMGEYILANVTANGQSAACNVTIYTPQGNKSIVTSNGFALFNATNQFYIIADKMFFEPAFYAFKPYNISGIKFDDANGNGTRDVGEAGLPGWTISLKRADGASINTTTDVNGTYKFENLTAGTYTISEIAQPGWVQTYPILLGSHVINIIDKNITNIDFGNLQKSNSPPDTPSTPSGNFAGISSAAYSYSTSATDPDGDQIAVHLRLGRWSEYDNRLSQLGRNCQQRAFLEFPRPIQYPSRSNRQQWCIFRLVRSADIDGIPPRLGWPWWNHSIKSLYDKR